MVIGNFLLNGVAHIARYVLFPIYVALAFYIGVILLTRKRGIALKETFHRKFMTITLFLTFGATAFFAVPSDYLLPLGDLAVKNLIGLTIFAVLIQYIIFVSSLFLSQKQTTISLGFGAGLRRSTIAANNLSPRAAEDEEFSWTAATSIMLANTVAIARNFIVILVVGAYMGLYLLPPKTFILPMGAMFLVSAVSTGIFFKKSGGPETIEYEPVSIKGNVLFVSFFVVMYYIARDIIVKGYNFAFYIITVILGFVYGAAYILIITVLFFTKYLGPEAGLIGAMLVTMGAIISDIPYTYLAGAEKLTKIILVSEIAAISTGVVVYLYLVL